MSYINKLRQATPFGFGSDIVPSKHLKQFSSRIAGSGSGALAGAVTFSAGAITAIALTDGGANYSSTTTRVLITGNGTGAAATATIVGGEITGFTVTAGGTGYTSATVYIVDGPVVVLAGDASDPNQWEMNYAHSSDVFTENHGETTVRTVTATIQAFGVPIRLPSYTVAGLPGAGTVAAGGVAFVTNESGGAVMAFSDGTNWRRVTDRAVVS